MRARPACCKLGCRWGSYRLRWGFRLRVECLHWQRFLGAAPTYIQRSGQRKRGNLAMQKHAGAERSGARSWGEGLRLTSLSSRHRRPHHPEHSARWCTRPEWHKACSWSPFFPSPAAGQIEMWARERGGKWRVEGRKYGGGEIEEKGGDRLGTGVLLKTIDFK